MLLSVLKKIFFRQVDEREQIMYLMIGLGNPGSRYARTRHNIGFMVLEKIAAQWKISLTQKSFDALWNRGKINNVSVLLAMPQTYMNLSGKSVGRLMAYYKVDIDHVIVIHDDLDLPFGTIRLKKGGGDAGHKGLKSVITALGSADFLRIRMGIGKPADKAGVENYVLQKFNQEEQGVLPESIQLAAEAAADIVISGMQQAMAKYHTKNIK
ncbi:MAG TPA: aminoacyl-tRNA hydrolase [Smithella sp.]|nr:aminoacyl-tRNA hydrolase [Smithella sp.]HOE32593.1 aminoacyl-tRNA hydrolase [Smithella sp.]HOG09025.1 aminoacyl-tRNA hydrolase [Smithella sp.]HOX98865.1 aminoacyl-tRNA hydrolase [Smithella sp.]HPC08128.1 aminoacyl-tRNA hydrolase [Smithella sp.]